MKQENVMQTNSKALCHDCETVSHCIKNGCIPKVDLKETKECNEQLVDYSSTVIASIVAHLTGTQSTTIIIPSALSVTHLSPVTGLMQTLELLQFFNENKRQ